MSAPRTVGGLLSVLLVGCAPTAVAPVPPAPSPVVEEVRFRCGDNLLAGVVIRPSTDGPHPALALVYGSEGVDRNYGGTGPQLWGHFARHGFAVLAWDKPGVGQSTGDYNAQTFRDRADEALAALRFLRGRAEVRPDRVGLWGHSHGGAVVPLAASQSDDVAFVIAVGGGQVVAWRQDALRVEAQLRADGFPDADIEAAVAFARRRMDLIRGQGPFEELERTHAAVEKLPWFEYVGRCDRGRFYGARRLVEYDPGPAWEKVRCPVLALYGDKDTSLPAEHSLPIIRRGLATAGNHDVTIRVFAGADHGMRPARAGGPKEARERARSRRPGEAPALVPGYLDAMTDWLRERFGSVR